MSFPSLLFLFLKNLGDPDDYGSDRSINIGKLGEKYSILWEGWFKNPYKHDLVVRFMLTSDDASALYIKNKLVVDNLG